MVVLGEEDRLGCWKDDFVSGIVSKSDDIVEFDQDCVVGHIDLDEELSTLILDWVDSLYGSHLPRNLIWRSNSDGLGVNG